MPPRPRRWWPVVMVVLLLLLMGVLLVRMASPRQPGMPGTGTINYGTPAAPADGGAGKSPPASMPGMDMGAPAER